MANEVTILELKGDRNNLRPLPFLAVQRIDAVDDVSAAFQAGTTAISIKTTVDCDVEIIDATGGDPDGTGAQKFLLEAADGFTDFAVPAGGAWKVGTATPA